MKPLPWKTALVTGASSGIGRAFAVELARGGTRPILLARREQRLLEAAEEIRRLTGIEAEVRVCDLLDADARAAMLRDLLDPERLPDLLVSNAAFGMNRRFLDSDLDRMTELVELGLQVPTELLRVFGDAMAQRGRGAILQVSSIAAFVPTPFHAVYSATKAAVRSLAESLDAELAPRGVRVCTLCPGVTDTEFFEAGRYLTRSIVYKAPRQSPASVAQAGIRGLARGRRTVVAGLRNRLLLAFTRVLPESFVVRSAGRTMSTD